MTTFGALIDRTYREWLNPADDYPTFSALTDDITDTDTTLPFDVSLMLVEETDLLDAGVILEIDRELIIAGGVDITAGNLIGVRRGAFGTEAAQHASGALIFVNPEVTRQAVFDALRDEIANLHPPLFRVRSVEAWADNWEMPADATAALGSFRHDGQGWVNGGGFDLIHGDPDSPTGVTARLRAPHGQRNLLQYKAPFGLPFSEEDELATLGLDDTNPELLRAVKVGAVAEVIASFDLKSATQEFITEALERHGYPVGSTERLRNSLIQYRELLVERQVRKLKSIHRVSTSTADPFG